jgi:hypothetical protein
MKTTIKIIRYHCTIILIKNISLNWYKLYSNEVALATYNHLCILPTIFPHVASSHPTLLSCKNRIKSKTLLVFWMEAEVVPTIPASLMTAKPWHFTFKGPHKIYHIQSIKTWKWEGYNIKTILVCFTQQLRNANYVIACCMWYCKCTCKYYSWFILWHFMTISEIRWLTVNKMKRCGRM